MGIKEHINTIKATLESKAPKDALLQRNSLSSPNGELGEELGQACQSFFPPLANASSADADDSEGAAVATNDPAVDGVVCQDLASTVSLQQEKAYWPGRT